MITLYYFSGGVFETEDGEDRVDSWPDQGWYPYGQFDGIVNFSMDDYANYGMHTDGIDERLATPSPVTIVLNQTDSGSVDITVTNISENTFGGVVQVVISESNIPYTWYDHDEINHLVRDYLPDTQGETIELEASESVTLTRSFTIADTWERENCCIVSFVEGSDTEIYQAAVIDME